MVGAFQQVLVVSAVVSAALTSCMSRDGSQRASDVASLDNVNTNTRNPDGTFTVTCMSGETKYNVSQARLQDPNDKVCVGGGGGLAQECRTFDPLTEPAGAGIKTIKHQGYPDDGTLTYPDGSVFLKRHAGYADDYSLFYPRLKPLVVRNRGGSNDRMMYWPEGNKIMRLSRQGYDDDGTIFRPNGTDKWLQRKRSVPQEDRILNGPPSETVGRDSMLTKVVVPTTGELKFLLALTDVNYRITISILVPETLNEASPMKISVTECY